MRGPQSGDAARGEGVGGLGPQPPVVGTVGRGHAGDGGERQQRPARADPPLAQGGEVPCVLGCSGMLQELLQRLVPEDGHALDATGQLDRSHGAPCRQPGVGGVRSSRRRGSGGAGGGRPRCPPGPPGICRQAARSSHPGIVRSGGVLTRSPAQCRNEWYGAISTCVRPSGRRCQFLFFTLTRPPFSGCPAPGASASQHHLRRALAAGTRGVVPAARRQSQEPPARGPTPFSLLRSVRESDHHDHHTRTSS